MVNSLLAVLETYEIVIIVVVAAAFIGVIVAALIFRSKRRRTVDETVLDSRDEVNENANAVKVLQALAEGKSKEEAREISRRPWKKRTNGGDAA